MLSKKTYNKPNKLQNKIINKQNSDTSLDYFKITVFFFFFCNNDLILSSEINYLAKKKTFTLRQFYLLEFKVGRLIV